MFAWIFISYKNKKEILEFLLVFQISPFYHKNCSFLSDENNPFRFKGQH